MKKNKINNFCHFFKFFLIILTFVINSCGEDGGGSQQIKNLKQTQLSISDDKNLLKDLLKDCDVKYTIEDFTNNNLIDPKYKFFSAKNYGEDYAIVVYGKFRIGDDKKFKREVRKEFGGDVFYLAVFTSKSGAIDTWSGEGQILSAESLVPEREYLDMVEALEEAKKDMLDEGFTEAEVKKFSFSKTKFALRKKKTRFYITWNYF